MGEGNEQNLEHLEEQFREWRQTRARGSRIPAPLWEAAVKAAGEYGVYKTSKRLGLEYDVVVRRMKEASGASEGVGAVDFVEIPGKIVSGGSGCAIEIEDGKGMRLRVELCHATGVESVARSLWKARR